MTAPQKFLHFELRGIEVLYGWLTQLHGPSVVKQCLSTLRNRKKFMHRIVLYQGTNYHQITP